VVAEVVSRRYPFTPYTQGLIGCRTLPTSTVRTGPAVVAGAESATVALPETDESAAEVAVTVTVAGDGGG
jgi:hypothetical protein